MPSAFATTKFPTCPAYLDVPTSPGDAEGAQKGADGAGVSARSKVSDVFVTAFKPEAPRSRPVGPFKIKELSAAKNRAYQQALAREKIAPMPYSPRQYFNGQGERYVATRSMFAGTFGRVRLGIRSSDGAAVALKEVLIAGQWRPSAGPKVPNPHNARGRVPGAPPGRRHVTPQSAIAREIQMAQTAEIALSPSDAFVNHGRAVVVTPLMEGDCHDLVNRVIQSGNLKARRSLAMSFMGQVAFEMKHVHANGIVHRDLKFENVMHDARGRLHVTDFGHAAVLPEGAYMMGVAVGTAGYIPCEAFSRKLTDHRFDVFSLGVMVASTALGRMLIAGDHMALDTFELDAWVLNELPRIESDGDHECGQEEIDEAALANMAGPRADMVRTLIAVLGKNTATFVLDRMLTGAVRERASMEEVFDYVHELYIKDPELMTMAMRQSRWLAQQNASRQHMLRALQLFDRMVPKA